MRQVENLQFVIEHLQENQSSLAEKIREFIRANVEVKVGKINIFDFCGKDSGRPILSGAYYDEQNKTVCASDGMVLLASKSAYKEEFAGRVINKSGEFVDGDWKYPNYVGVIKGFANYETRDFPFTKEEVLEKIKTYQALHKLNPKVVTEENTILIIDKGLGVNMRMVRLMAKLDVTHLKLRYNEWMNEVTFQCVTYSDEDCKAIFMARCFDKDDNWRLEKDGLSYPRY